LIRIQQYSLSLDLSACHLINGAANLHSTTAEARPTLGSLSLTNGQLASVTLGRLALNVAYRIIYPLQPFLAQHLHVDLRMVSALVTVQVLASIVSPLGGTLADTRGERATMTAGLSLFCIGAALCALSGGFGGFLAGYALIGLAVALYQPAAQAYLSKRTSYERRGWALGVFETSWAAAALLGVAPLMQLVQQTGSSVAVFWILLAAGACSLALIRFGLPRLPNAGVGSAHQAAGARQPIDWRALRTPSVVGVLGLLLLVACATDMMFVVQGAWSKAAFGANDAQLGQVFGMLGIAELIGSLSSTVLVDRVGKKRAVLAGYLLTAAAMFVLPLSEGSWLLFLPLYFLFDLFFEFSIVASFPLVSGVAPTVRGTLMALSVLILGVGRAIGSQLATPLWSSYGIWANGLIGAGLLLAGILLCWALVRENEAEGTGEREQATEVERLAL
jgi:MFS transporter, DHA1 family, inner membrane transport protein